MVRLVCAQGRGRGRGTGVSGPGYARGSGHSRAYYEQYAEDEYYDEVCTKLEQERRLWSQEGPLRMPVLLGDSLARSCACLPSWVVLGMDNGGVSPISWQKRGSGSLYTYLRCGEEHVHRSCPLVVGGVL